jgi:excisionase family DNA binding protein
MNPRSRPQERPVKPSGAAQAAAGSAAAVEPGLRVPEPAAERLAYSVDEAARLTGLSRDLLYDEMRRGHLIYVKIGRRRLITRHHLRQFLGVAP